MSARPWRQRALFGALVVTITLSLSAAKVWQTEDPPALPSKVRLPHASRAPASPQPRVQLERLQGQAASPEIDTVVSGAFRAMSWYVAPPPPPPRPAPKLLPPPPPTAPPMPFSFMGRYEEGAARIILLLKGDRIYTVSEGEVIDNTYRVGPLAGGQLELTYLPLDIKQTISAGGT